MGQKWSIVKTHSHQHTSVTIGGRGGCSVTHLVILPLTSLAPCSGTPRVRLYENCVIFQELECYGLLRMSAKKHCWIRTILGLLIYRTPKLKCFCII